MAPKRTDNNIKDNRNTHLKKQPAKMGNEPVTRTPRSNALRTGGGAPGGGATGAQHARALTAQWESVRLGAEAHTMARAREASRLRALAASASVVSAPPHMRGHAAARRLYSPPTSMLGYSESATHASALDQFHAARAATAASASISAPPQMPGPAAAHRLVSPPTSMLSYSGSATHASVLEQFHAACAAAASASISAQPQTPGPAAAHRLVSPPTSMLGYSESATHASVPEQFHAAVAAARAAMPPQPVMQQAHEDAPKEDHRPQQRWGDHVIDAADADIAAAEYAKMFLDESLHEQETENEKKYWANIMNLVNSPSASQTAAAMPAAREAASSSSASLQTSVVMPAPEASSSSSSAAAVSFSTSVGVPAPTLQRWTSDPNRSA